MEFDHRTLQLDQIDETDRTFRISTGPATDSLKASIQRVGLINAPVLMCRGDRFIIVSGFLRIAACRELGRTCIEARCLHANAPFYDAASLAIGDNAGQRSLNIVELARAIGLAAKETPRVGEQIELLQSFGLPVNKSLAEKLHRVLQLSDRLQAALADASIALPIALRLQDLGDMRVADELCTLFQEMNLSLSRQRELLDWLQGIALRERINIAVILEDDRIRQWRQDPRMDPGHRSQLIRLHLKKRRYPAITAYEQNYARGIKELKLPPGVHLIAPVHFEGQTYSLRLDFKNPQELLAAYREVQRLLESPTFSELIEPDIRPA